MVSFDFVLGRVEDYMPMAMLLILALILGLLWLAPAAIVWTWVFACTMLKRSRNRA